MKTEWNGDNGTLFSTRGILMGFSLFMSESVGLNYGHSSRNKMKNWELIYIRSM